MSAAAAVIHAESVWCLSNLAVQHRAILGCGISKVEAVRGSTNRDRAPMHRLRIRFAVRAGLGGLDQVCQERVLG